jgi:hypothetical protein
MKKLILLTFLFLFVTACNAAVPVKLVWDLSNSDSELGTGGYRMYSGKTCEAITPISTVPAGINTLILQLPVGQYCFAVTAFSSDNQESDFSNKLPYIVKPGTPGNLKIEGLK